MKLFSLAFSLSKKYADKIPETIKSPFENLPKFKSIKPISIENLDKENLPETKPLFVLNEDEESPETVDLETELSLFKYKLMVVVDFMASYNFITLVYSNVIKERIRKADDKEFENIVQELKGISFKLLKDQEKYFKALQKNIESLNSLSF